MSRPGPTCVSTSRPTRGNDGRLDSMGIWGSCDTIGDPNSFPARRTNSCAGPIRAVVLFDRVFTAGGFKGAGGDGAVLMVTNCAESLEANCERFFIKRQRHRTKNY